MCKFLVSTLQGFLDPSLGLYEGAASPRPPHQRPVVSWDRIYATGYVRAFIINLNKVSVSTCARHSIGATSFRARYSDPDSDPGSSECPRREFLCQGSTLVQVLDVVRPEDFWNHWGGVYPRFD